jgi:hypothetical protein
MQGHVTQGHLTRGFVNLCSVFVLWYCSIAAHAPHMHLKNTRYSEFRFHIFLLLWVLSV